MYSSVHSCSTVRTYLLLSWVKLNSGRCQFDSSARSSKIKIRTSSRPKANELATSGHGQIRSWSLQTRAAAPRARDAWIFFLENLRNPARIRRAGLMRQFSSGQLDSSHLQDHAWPWVLHDIDPCVARTRRMTAPTGRNHTKWATLSRLCCDWCHNYNLLLLGAAFGKSRSTQLHRSSRTSPNACLQILAL